jgi:FkbH-like protein
MRSHVDFPALQHGRIAVTPSLRQQIEDCISNGLWAKAQAGLAELWRNEPTSARAGYILARSELLRTHLSLTRCRLAIMRSFTVEPVVPLLRAAAFINGIDLTVQVGQFNTYAQEILNSSSALYAFSPDVVILAVQTRDLAPELWYRCTDLSPAEVESVVTRVIGEFANCVRLFCARSTAHLIIHSLEEPAFPNQGLLDSQGETGQLAAIRKINQALARLAGKQKGLYLLDYDGLVARHGRARWHDERKWLSVRMPIAADHLIHLANEWLRFLHPLLGKTCKALVTDLDNTLWGGIVGEDGMEGIQLGIDYPGAAFHTLQRAMLDLHQRGILLAVCSKNNVSDAMEALEKHPGMLLKPEHFAALRINWNDKVQNLREIAAELNIGIDALAFLDDNPVERERVRTELPEVTVIELPDDPMEFARSLRETPGLERLTLTDEDRERGGYYVQQRQRLELERSTSSLEDFYRSLRQEVEIVCVTSGTLTRIAQLTQKTNQFNLTTRRYSEQQISAMTDDPDWKIYSIRVKDRFGDNGIVGVAMTHDSDGICEIDNFLMSCRVIGRTVETALMSFLLEEAKARKVNQVRGWYLATKKNDLAKEFYALHGFNKLREQNGDTLWSLDLNETEMRCPEWIKLTPEEVIAV